MQFYYCLPTVMPVSTSSSFETTHFAVCPCVIWKALNDPGTSSTWQTLTHSLSLNLSWQVPHEMYSKFTQIKNTPSHCTLLLNHCIPPIPLHKYCALPLHYILDIFLLESEFKASPNQSCPLVLVIGFLTSWHKCKFCYKMRSLKDCYIRSLEGLIQHLLYNVN